MSWEKVNYVCILYPSVSVCVWVWVWTTERQLGCTQVIQYHSTVDTEKYKYFLFWNVWPNCHLAIFNKKGMNISEQLNGNLALRHSNSNANGIWGIQNTLLMWTCLLSIFDSLIQIRGSIVCSCLFVSYRSMVINGGAYNYKSLSYKCN